MRSRKEGESCSRSLWHKQLLTAGQVGIVGMGGIGHYGVLFAKALGAETWAISRTHSKEADMKKCGADGFIATEDKDWEVPHKLTFDLIVNTANASEGFELGKYLSMMDVHGHFVSVGLPEDSGNMVHAKDLISNGVLMGASHIGNRKETIEMLQLAADKGIKSMVQTIPISETGLKEAVTKLKKNDVRYRFTMTDYDKAFPDA